MAAITRGFTAVPLWYQEKDWKQHFYSAFYSLVLFIGIFISSLKNASGFLGNEKIIPPSWFQVKYSWGYITNTASAKIAWQSGTWEQTEDSIQFTQLCRSYSNTHWNMDIFIGLPTFLSLPSSLALIPSSFYFWLICFENTRWYSEQQFHLPVVTNSQPYQKKKTVRDQKEACSSIRGYCPKCI